MKYLIHFIVLVFMIGLVSAGTLTENDFERTVIRQAQVDEDFPCYVYSDNQVKCDAANASQQNDFKSKIGVLGNFQLSLLGVPVRNLQGRTVSWSHIPLDQDTIINVDTTRLGSFKVGFDSNVFIIISISGGVFNNTEELGGNIVFDDTGQLSGEYWSEIMDANSTSSFINMTWDETQPDTSSIGMQVRSFNITDDGSDLADQLRGYFKLDSSNCKDYSGNNISCSPLGTITTTKDGRIDNAFLWDDGNIVGRDERIAIGNTTEFANLCINGCTLSAWVYLSDSARTRTILAKHDASDSNRFLIWETYYRVPRFRIFQSGDSGPSCTSSSGLAIRLNTWTHIAVVFDTTANTIDSYQNGSLVRSQECTVNPDPWTDEEQTFIGIRDDSSLGNEWDGRLDEVGMWNRSLNAGNISVLFNQSVIKNWSDLSPIYASSPSDLNVSDGRYVQLKSLFQRDNTGVAPSLNNFTVAFDTAGAAPGDNPPTVTLDTFDQASFPNNVTLDCSAIDDNGLVNMSLWTNTTGTWHLNQSINLTGISNSTSFNITNLTAGTYLWNCEAYDNNKTNDFADANRTFIVSPSCTDASCPDGFVCNPNNNQCYSSCSSHTHCNATSFCDTDATCSDQIADTSSCANLELPGLADDNICTGGFCFTDDFELTGEYCTDTSNGCVDEGIEFNQGSLHCLTSTNDYQSCIGGESDWGLVQDCIDAGDPVNGSTGTPSISTHGACGFFSDSSCVENTGCSTPAENECGSFAYDIGSVGCGAGTSFCDAGCGATFDLETCPFPNTLSSDCSTCTAPTGNNSAPDVDLVRPFLQTTISNTTTDMTYTVTDEDPLLNCSLYFNTTSVAWHLNRTNSSTISRTEENSFDDIEFSDGDSVTWNVECTDEDLNTSFAPANFSFNVDTSALDRLKFEIWNGSEGDGDLLFTIDETGEGTVKDDFHVGGTLFASNILTTSPVSFEELLSSIYIDIDSNTSSGVRITNPFNEYIRFEGKGVGGGDIMFGLFGGRPTISTDSGDKIIFAESIDITSPLQNGTVGIFSGDGTKSLLLSANDAVLSIRTFGGLPLELKPSDGRVFLTEGGENNSLNLWDSDSNTVQLIAKNMSFETNATNFDFTTNDASIKIFAEEHNVFGQDNGESLELHGVDGESKPYIGWYGFDPTGGFDTGIGWLGCHYNLSNGNVHQHCSWETLDNVTGTPSINTKFEIGYGRNKSQDDLFAQFSSLGQVRLGSGVDLWFNDGNVLHAADFDIFPGNQGSIALRVKEDGTNLELQALGTDTVQFLDKLDLVNNVTMNDTNLNLDSNTTITTRATNTQMIIDENGNFEFTLAA